ncbi:MAG: nucleotidyl transferase AbiEii/AbiGii toxin family protein [Capsulimonas sp.]|uniref:nucleotidyl transferase AbiEii/AbiGii toxin family protein n=1 Tax=Capsulimonas sp. TaxID=2494211 RepID=UPI003266BBCE
MSTPKYRSQVLLLLDILPAVADEECFALHGGTAINLFVRDMPRLSVDLDLTYLLIEDRGATLANIIVALRSIQTRITAKSPSIRITIDTDRFKLLCSRQGIQVKIEVNTTMRGALGAPKMRVLSEKTQSTFDRFAEMRIMPLGQVYGGKICAALSRQHPRDLFDIKYMLQNSGFDDEIKRGFLLCLLSGERPIHEMLRPALLDQQATMEHHFAGMTEEPFGYAQFEETRNTLIAVIHNRLTETDREFLISFKNGSPEWDQYSFADFQRFPAVQWKLQNIRKLKETNGSKHRGQLEALKASLSAVTFEPGAS